MYHRAARLRLLLACGVSAFSYAEAALAQATSSTTSAASGEQAAPTGLEEIIVTARRREESQQSVPVAVTAISSASLEARNVVALDQVARIAPGLTLYQTAGSVGGASVFMRGIGYADNTVGQDSPIGFYLDGVSSGRIGTAVLQLVEPERVEVLRGPQGTLFGRNTTGGALLVTTHTPTDRFSGTVKASYGTFNARSVQARIDSGLLGSSGIKLSIAGQYRRQDGYIDNARQPSSRDPGANEGKAFFLKAVGSWGRLTATLTGDYNISDGVPASLQIVDATPAVRNFLALSPGYGGVATTITRDALYDLPSDGTLRQHVWARGLALTLNFEVSDALAIKSISGLRGYDRDDPIGDGPADIRGNVGTVAVPRIVSFNGLYGQLERRQHQHQASEELQLLGKLGDLDYVVGGYYFDEGGRDYASTRIVFVTGTGATALDIAQVRGYSVHSRSIAGFGQLNWRPAFLDRKLELSGGLRWTRDTRDFDQTAGIIRSANLKTNNTSFLLSADYRWTPDIMTFVRYSTGYRAGGFNVRAAATVNPIFQPEKLRSLEAGFKMDLLDRHVRLNATGFYNRYKDLQVAQFVPSTSAGTGGNSSINANATYRGFEVEAQVVPVEGVTLSGTYGYVDPRYRSYPQPLGTGGAVTAGCTPITASGATIAQNCAAIAAFVFYPRTTYTFGAAYTLPRSSYGQWSLRADYSHKSHVEFGTFNLPSTPFRDIIAARPYGLLSARIALSEIPLSGSATAQIALFGDNLTDRAYNLQGIDFGTFATATFGQPRTVGIEAKISF